MKYIRVVMSNGFVLSVSASRGLMMMSNRLMMLRLTAILLAAQPVHALHESRLVLNDFITSGRYGSVCWAEVDGIPCVA